LIFAPWALTSPYVETLWIGQDRNMHSPRDLFVSVVVIGMHGPREARQQPREEHAVEPADLYAQHIAALRAEFQYFIGCARHCFRQERDHRLRIRIMNRDPELVILAHTKAHALAECSEEIVRRGRVADRDGKRTGVFDVSGKILAGT